MANIAKPTNLNNIWAAGGTRVDPGVTKTNIGWVVQLPPYEYQNWAMNRADTAIAHFNQHGIPEWDTLTEYQGNLSYTQGSNGFIYKCLQTHVGLNPTNINNNLYWKLAFEEYGSVQVVQSALNAHLANYATLSGIANVVAARANLSVWSKAESDARFAFKGGDNATPFLVGNASNGQHAVPLSQLSSLLVAATEATFGTTRYATNAETETGTVDNRAITPLKASTVYLKKSGNLAGLTNLVTARANLGLADMAEISSVSVMFRYQNLAGLTDLALSRSNLGLGTIATAAAGAYLQTSNNLGEYFGNATTARANLGLTSTATTPLGNIMLKADSLAGIGNPAQARLNLGLSDSGLYPSNTWLIRTSNLGDLTNVQTARNNLGLADSATIPSANFLYAANNLSELPNKPQARLNLGLTAVANADPNIFMYKGENLIGLTNLAAARANLGLGGLATANAVGILGPDIVFTNNWDAAGGATILPNFVKMQWGSVTAGGSVTFRYPFTQSYSVTVTHGPNALGAPGAGVTGKTLNGFTLGYGTGGYMWIAIGV
jgi:hypothetical protein